MNQIGIPEQKYTITKIKTLTGGFNHGINGLEENMGEQEDKSYFRWKHSEEYCVKTEKNMRLKGHDF